MAGGGLRPVDGKQRHPALLLESLTPVYDLFARLFLPEIQFKRDLIAHARIAPGQRVLDLGAGNGTSFGMLYYPVWSIIMLTMHI